MRCDVAADTTESWAQASIMLNCAAYGQDLHDTVGHQLALSCLLALLLAPLAAVLSACSSHEGARTGLLSGGNVQVVTTVFGAYSLVAGRAASTSMSEWRDAHMPPFSVDFCALQTLAGSLAIVCLAAQAALATRGRSCCALTCSGVLASMLLPFYWYFGVVHALGFGADWRPAKEVFGHLVIGVAFVCWGGIMLCCGPDLLVLRTATHRIEHRVMTIAGLIYGQMERMSGNGYLQMHFITATAWAVFGVLGLLLEVSHPEEARRGTAMSIALFYHGFMMYHHHQATYTAMLLHVTHGVLTIMGGMLRFAGMPKLSGLVIQVAGFVFLVSQKGATNTAIALWGDHAAQTYVLLSLQCGVLLVVLPTLVIFNVARRYGCEGTLRLQLCQRCNVTRDDGCERGDSQTRGMRDRWGGGRRSDYSYSPIALSDKDDEDKDAGGDQGACKMRSQPKSLIAVSLHSSSTCIELCMLPQR